MLHTSQLNESVPNRFEQRGSFRVYNPVLQVTLGEHTYGTENWSLNGLLLKGMLPEISLDKEIEGFMNPQGTVERCHFKGRIVRIDLKESQFAIELDGQSREVAAFLPLWVLKYGATAK